MHRVLAANLLIHLLYMKPTQITVNALQCKTAHLSSVRWQL